MREGQEAIGARLLRVSGSRYTLTLVTDRGTLELNADGECCSDSWFESWESDAEGGLITSLEFDGDDRLATDHDDWSDGCERKVYFGAIKTTKGRVLYELRNESNGYYGGSVSLWWKAA